MRKQPQQVVVDGRPMLAVSAKEFEALLAMRRQLGSQTAKMRIMRDTLNDMSEFLDTLVEVLDGDDPADPQEVLHPAGSPRSHPELVAEIRRRAQQVRAITGAGRAAHTRHPSSRTET